MASFVNIWDLSKHTLFDDIELPKATVETTNSDGTTTTTTYTADKDVLINSIFDECAEYEPITLDPDFLKLKINNFFKKNNVGFSHLFQINYLEYNPIENYDRTSDQNTKGKTSNTSTDIGNNSTTSETNTTQETTNSGDDTTEHKTSAFNVTDYQNKEKTVTTLNDKQNVTVGNKNNITGTTSNTTNGSGTNDVTFHDRTHGNIGITTAQDMMTEEKDFWTEFNIYDVIAQKFLFTLCIYIDD